MINGVVFPSCVAKSLGDDQYFGGLSPRTAIQWHLFCYFLSGTILAWGAQTVIWGGTSCDLRGHNSGMPPWHRACVTIEMITVRFTNQF